MQNKKEPRERIDDSEHDLMYKSPGSQHGGHGRTYDYVHVKNDDDREHFASQGYFPTLQEAYEKAGKPLSRRELVDTPHYDPEVEKKYQEKLAAGKKGGTKKSAEVDPIEGEGPSLKDVQAALKKLRDAKDAKAVTAVLKPFEVKAATELKPEQYAEVIAAAEEAAK